MICRGGWYCSRPYKSTICCHPFIGAAGKTAPTEGYQPPLETFFYVVEYPACEPPQGYFVIVSKSLVEYDQVPKYLFPFHRQSWKGGKHHSYDRLVEDVLRMIKIAGTMCDEVKYKTYGRLAMRYYCNQRNNILTGPPEQCMLLILHYRITWLEKPFLPATQTEKIVHSCHIVKGLLTGFLYCTPAAMTHSEPHEIWYNLSPNRSIFLSSRWDI